MTSDAVYIAMIAAVPGAITGIAGLVASLRNGRKVDSLHIIVNSRLTELLQQTGDASRAEGKAEGVKQEKSDEAERKTYESKPTEKLNP